MIELTLLGSRLSFFALLTFLLFLADFLRPDTVFAISRKLIYLQHRITGAGGLLTVVSTSLLSTRLHLPFSSPNAKCFGISI